jgi:SAM-dependent methyltransferase
MLFKEANLKPIIVGLLKRYEILRKLLPLHTGGTNSSRYCYSVWLRHLIKLNTGDTVFLPASVAELGPGDSLGIGIAALLSGVEEYLTLDIQKYWNPGQNVRMLRDLLALFEKEEPIPDEKEFPNVFPRLDDYSFPSSVLSDDRLKLSLAPDRIEAIRKELMNPDGADNIMIKYFIPWSNPNVICENSIDLILSQAVLEHIDDLKNTYQAMRAWLKDGGVMSHVIDFKSHGFTKSWNGHWTLSKFEWKLIRGGRVYAINREPFSIHIKFMNEFGFKITTKELRKLPSKITINQLSESFSQLSHEDISVSGMYVIAKKEKSI